MVIELNLTPIARMVSCAVAGVDPLYMGIGPCAAIPKALKQGGLKLNDIDQIELKRSICYSSFICHSRSWLKPRHCKCKWWSHCSWASAWLYWC